LAAASIDLKGVSPYKPPILKPLGSDAGQIFVRADAT
jgi:hypothetical protein